jgi:flagellar biosynthesis component FlhA
MDFDIDGIMEKVTEIASEKILSVLHESKREMGAEGDGIQIEENSAMMGTGDNMSIAGVTCPSEEIKDKFLAIVQRNLGS